MYLIVSYTNSVCKRRSRLFCIMHVCVILASSHQICTSSILASSIRKPFKSPCKILCLHCSRLQGLVQFHQILYLFVSCLEVLHLLRLHGSCLQSLIQLLIQPRQIGRQILSQHQCHVESDRKCACSRKANTKEADRQWYVRQQ